MLDIGHLIALNSLKNKKKQIMVRLVLQNADLVQYYK